MESKRIKKADIYNDFVKIYHIEISAAKESSNLKQLIFVNNVARIFLDYTEKTYWKDIWKITLKYHKEYLKMQ